MDEPKLWIVGAVALALVVAALVWVVRHRGTTPAPPAHPHYGTPLVMGGQGPGTGLTFGDDAGGDIDSTVPLSRLGGAGWRDGGGVPAERTTDAYAGQSPTWAEGESGEGSDGYAPHVEVDQTLPRSALSEEADRERGGHW